MVCKEGEKSNSTSAMCVCTDVRMCAFTWVSCGEKTKNIGLAYAGGKTWLRKRQVSWTVAQRSSRFCT